MVNVSLPEVTFNFLDAAANLIHMALSRVWIFQAAMLVYKRGYLGPPQNNMKHEGFKP